MAVFNREQYEKRKKERGEAFAARRAVYTQKRNAEISANIQNKVKTWADSHNAYLKAYTDRFGGRKGDGTDAFVSDAADWYNTATATGNSLKSSANDILADLERNRYIYGDAYVDEISGLLRAGIADYDSIAQYAKADIDYWNQFTPTEEEAANGITTSEKYQNSKLYNAPMADLSKEVDWAKTNIDVWTQDEKNAWEVYQNRLADTNNYGNYEHDAQWYWDEYMSYVKGREDAQSHYDQLKGIYDSRQKAAADEKAYQEVMKPYTPLTSNADFSNKSQYVSTVTGKKPSAVSSWTLEEADYVYEYINNQNNYRDRYNIAWRQMNALADTNTPFVQPDQKSDLERRNYDYLTQDEVAIYNYLYATDKKKADEFLNGLADTLKTRQATAKTTYYTAMAEEHPILSSIIDIATAPQQGWDYGKMMLDAAITGDIDQRDYADSATYRNSVIKSVVSEGINEKWGGAAKYAYDLGMGIGENVSSMVYSSMFTLGMPQAVTGNLIKVVMGSGAAASVTLDALQKGSSTGQAVMLGTSAGIIEGVTESIGIDALFDTAKLKTGLTSYLLKNGMAEFSEEAISSISNDIVEAFVMRGESEFMKDVDSVGVGQAIYNVLTRAGESGIGGFLSGIAMAGGFSGVNAAGNALGTFSEGKYITGAKTGVTGLQSRAAALMTGDLDASTKTKIQDLSGKVTGEAATGKGLGKISAGLQNYLNAYRAGKLYNAVNEGYAELNATDLTNRLVNSGYSEEVAGELADALIAQNTGAELTSEQRKILKAEGNTEAVQKVQAEVFDDPMSGMNMRAMDMAAYHTKLAFDHTAKEIEKTAEKAKSSSPTEATSDPATHENSTSASGLTRTEKVTAEASKAGKTATVADYASAYGETGAAEMQEVYAMGSGSQDAEKFAEAYETAYNWGYSGADKSYLYKKDKRNLTDALSESQKLKAYYNGLRAARADNKSTKNPNKVIGKSRETWKEGSVSTYGKDADGNDLTIESIDKAYGSDVRGKTVKYLRMLAEITGVDIVLFASHEENGVLVGPVIKDGDLTIDLTNKEGGFVWNNNKIYLDINAGATAATDLGDITKNTMLRTFGHEFVHFMEKHNADEYLKFRAFVFKYMDKRMATESNSAYSDIDELIRARMVEENRDYDYCAREVLADALADIMPESQFAQELAKENGTWLDKLVDMLKQFIDDIKAALGGRKLTEQSAAMDIRVEIDGTLQYLQEIRQMYDKLAVGAVQNYQAAVAATEKKSAPPAKKETTTKVESKADGGVFENWGDGENDGQVPGYRPDLSGILDANAKPVNEDEILTEGAVVTDGAKVSYSIKSMKHDIAEGKMFEDLKKVCGWSQAQVDTLRDQLKALVEYMAPNADILDLNESYGMDGRKFAPFKPNSDPLYKVSLDFSTLCSKRLLTQYVIEQLQLRENRPMSAEEQMAIRDMLKEYRKVEKGLQVACAMCYVEAARLKSPKQIQKWLDDPTAALRSYFAKNNKDYKLKITKAQEDFKVSRGYARDTAKKDMRSKDVTELNKIGPAMQAKYTFTAEELEIVDRAAQLPERTFLTAANLARLSESEPEIYKAYVTFIRNATRSKSLETDEPYYYGDSSRDNGNGVVVTDTLIKQMNEENGLRFSSWSDWRIQHMLDYITAVIDCSVRGAAMHGYTKYGDEVRVLGKTGMMFNMSGVAGTQTGLDENGELSFSGTESIDVNEAKVLRDEHPDTAGLQCIGVSDAHIIKLLSSDLIDYVIPYHISGLNKALRRMADIHGWKDYTSTQHATVDKSISKENATDSEHWHEEPVFSEFFVGYDTDMTGIEAMRKSAENYIRMCQERGLKPKFAQFANEKNYWKLLIDRKMINQKTGNLIQQKAVQPVFDFDVIKQVVDKYVANYDSGVESRALKHILDNWDNVPQRIKDLKKQKATAKTKSSEALAAMELVANEMLAARSADVKVSGKKRGTTMTDREVLEVAVLRMDKSTFTEGEKSALEIFRKRLDALRWLQIERQRLGSIWHEQQFGTGDRSEAPKTLNRMQVLDGQIERAYSDLLSVEDKKVLRDVLQEAREYVKEKSVNHYKGILERRKDRSAQAQARRDLYDVVHDLENLLLRGDKQKPVPEGLKKTVSAALEIMNEKDIGKTEARIDVLVSEIAELEQLKQSLRANMKDENSEKLSKLFLEIDDRIKTLKKKLASAERFIDKLTDLRDAYQQIAKAGDSGSSWFYDELVAKKFDEAVTDVKGLELKDMTTEQLEKLHEAFKMLRAAVRNSNKSFVSARSESLDQRANKIANQFSGKKIPDKDAAIIAKKLADRIGWNYETLYYALDRIGSEAFTELVMNVANSENIVMQDVMEAMAFLNGTAKKYGYNNWAVNKKLDREFIDNTGKKFKLTLGEMMALYAYSRREGAWDHIEYGGFAFGKEALTDPKPADTYKLTREQCEAITDLLTEEQKAYAEEMQTYLSDVMGAKGNEVSMLMYDTKLFGEKNYFPVHIAGDFKAEANESKAKAEAGFERMVNAGFTYTQNKKAKAPFVLEGFNDIWIDHVNEMSRYHGAVPALEDMRRVMNRSAFYESTGDSVSMKQLMRNAYGRNAVAYFDNLYKEANRGAILDKMEKPAKKWVSLFKKNAVAYSLSVLIQQPASIRRAYAMIDQKYFGFKGFGTITGGVAKTAFDKWTKAQTKAYNEMLKYAPGVTMAKEIGGFDTATGKSIRSYLMDTGKTFGQKLKTGTAAEKGKAILDIVDDNAIANLPNLADKIAWIEIWNACKRETVAKHKDLATNSDEFMKIVGERFTEVIRATQVYDSIFAKSPMLKSENTFIQMVVSFMSEPNIVANMAEKSVRDLLKGNWKGATRQIYAIVQSVIFTNLLKSIVYAMRDDDEDEDFIEKYLEAVVSNLVNDAIPLNYIPYARDVWSILQGYDVERADMAIVADSINNLRAVIEYALTDTEDMSEKQLEELDKKMTKATWELVESLAAIVGLPVKNIHRDIAAAFNTAINTAANAGMATPKSVKDKINNAIKETIPFVPTDSKEKWLYDAIISGDKKYQDRLEATYREDTEDATRKAITSARKKALKENDPRITKMADAYWQNDYETLMDLYEEIAAEGHFTDEEIQGAYASRREERKDKFGIEDKPESNTAKNEPKSIFNAESYYRDAVSGDKEGAAFVKEDMLQYVDEKEFNSNFRGVVKKHYDDGDVSADDAEDLLVEYGGHTDEEASQRVRYWNFKTEHPDTDISIQAINKYYDGLYDDDGKQLHKGAGSFGISLDVYIDYYQAISGLNKDETCSVIDDLPLTKKQKDALYYLQGWSKSNISETPWH